jgi:ubiquinone/menaquinone biosynthesis C-methylase UbiE
MIYEQNKKHGYAVKFLNPDAILAEAGIKPGMAIAHFGCGSGHFTFAAAKLVGPIGQVFAFDVLREKIENIKSQIKILGVNNVTAERANLGDKESSKLPDESVDWVLLVNMLHQNDKKSKIIGEAKRVLKKGGHILLIEWKSDVDLMGPAKISRASREEMIKTAKKHDLGVAEIEAGDFHWGLVLRK